MGGVRSDDEFFRGPLFGRIVFLTLGAFLGDFMVFSQFLLECEDVLNDVPLTFELFAAMCDLNDFCFGSHFGITDLGRFMF